jgi:DNA polymerase alpha subunit A
MDGYMRKLLLLKKKKYAALISDGSTPIVFKEEVKGLDMVRRDWCQLSKTASHFILKQLLSELSREDAVNTIFEYLRHLVATIKSGDVEIDDFVIHKSLTKDPTKYDDAKSQPHVQVALKMQSKHIPVHIGDIIPFVVCLGQGSFSSRAFHPDELRKDKTLVIGNPHSCRHGMVHHTATLSTHSTIGATH